MAVSDATTRQALDLPYARDLAASATVLAGMSAAWLLWGSSMAEESAAGPMRLMIPVCLVLAVWAMIVRQRHRGPSLHDGGGGNAFWLRMVVIEIAGIAAGVLLLSWLDLPMLVICWVHLVMGVHWWPMATFYGIPSLRISAVVAVLVALAGFGWYAATESWPGVIVGGLGGLAMVAMAAYQIQQARHLTT